MCYRFDLSQCALYCIESACIPLNQRVWKSIVWKRTHSLIIVCLISPTSAHSVCNRYAIVDTVVVQEIFHILIHLIFLWYAKKNAFSFLLLGIVRLWLNFGRIVSELSRISVVTEKSADSIDQIANEANIAAQQQERGRGRERDTKNTPCAHCAANIPQSYIHQSDLIHSHVHTASLNSRSTNGRMWKTEWKLDGSMDAVRNVKNGSNCHCCEQLNKSTLPSGWYYLC